jgi:hypothetical protein
LGSQLSDGGFRGHQSGLSSAEVAPIKGIDLLLVDDRFPPTTRHYAMLVLIVVE